MVPRRNSSLKHTLASGLSFFLEEIAMNQKIVRISDCTLRQKNHFPVLSFREKLELCRLMDKLNVDMIEMEEIRQVKIDSLLIKSVCTAVRHAGIAVPVALNSESVRMTWDALKTASHPRLQVPAPVSSVQMEYLYHMKPKAMVAAVSDTIRTCREYTEDVEFIAEDATRSDGAFLREMISAAITAGASTITVCDSAGSMLPEETGAFISSLVKDIPDLENIVFGFSCIDQIKLADACAISAVQNGTREIKAASYQTDAISLMNIARILDLKSSAFGISCNVSTERIRSLTGMIETLCRTGLSRSIAGSYPNEDRESGFMLSTHDSIDSVRKAVEKLGYDLTADDMEKVWTCFSEIAEKKDLISLRELDAIVAAEAMQVPPVYHDIQYVINTGNTISAMAHMKLKYHDKEIEGIAAGDGSIDAAFNSIEKATGRHFELDDFQIQAITEGREAVGETIVKLRHEGKLYSGRGISTDIVGSGILAYLNALNKIVYEEEEA